MRIFVALLLFIFLFSCAENPVTKTKELMIFSELDEVRFGRNLDEEIRVTYGIYEDLSLRKYVEKVGKKVVSISHRPHLDFKFDILDTDEVNAFALPGGIIYVTRGILCYVNNEAQLAGILAHEVGHVSSRHSMKALQSAIGANILLNIIALGTGSQFWLQVSNIALSAIMAGYSRDYENQADSLSVEYAIKAGYDPYQMRDFLFTIKRMEGGKLGPLVGIFADHPLTEKRIKNVEERIREKADFMKGISLTTNEEEYLSLMDELPIEKKAGWIRDKNEMKNGRIGVAIPIIKGFTYDKGSGPDEIAIYDTQGNFIIEVTPIKGKSPLRGAIEEYEKKKALKKKVSMNFFKNKEGIPLCTYRVNGAEVKAVFLDLFPHTLAISIMEKSFSRGRALFDTLAEGARRLSEEEAEKYKEERIKVYEVRERGTLREIVRSLYRKQDEKLLSRLSIINGVQEDRILEKGKRIKLIVSGDYIPKIQ